MSKYYVTIKDWKTGRESHETVDGLKEVFLLCGAKLKRDRAGYGGMKGDFEYSAVRIK